MSALLEKGHPGLTGGSRVTGDEPWIRLGEVFRLRRESLRKQGLVLRDEPEMADDCRIVEGADILPFRFRGPERWASYREIREAFDRERAAGSTSNVSPYQEEDIFAPVRLILRDVSMSIRAVLTFEPIYPARGKVAVLLPGQSLWLAYAALAVLNSAIGQAFYRKLLHEEGKTESPHGLDKEVLERMPIAHRDRAPIHLERAALLSSQVAGLYEAACECGVDLERQVRSRRELLLNEVRMLLGLTQSRAEEMLATIPDVKCGDYGQDQLELFDDVVPLASLTLLSREERSRLQSLQTFCDRQALSADEQAEFQRLARLSFWEEALQSTPPEFSAPSSEPEPETFDPIPITSIVGASLPPHLQREKNGPGSYEFYPVTDHIVAAPGVCGDRLTFKGTRIDVRHVLDLLHAGSTPEEIVNLFEDRLPLSAVLEAMDLDRLNPTSVFERPVIGYSRAA